MPTHVKFSNNTDKTYRDLMAEFKATKYSFILKGGIWNCIDPTNGKMAIVIEDEIVILLNRDSDIGDWQIWMVVKDYKSNLSVPDLYMKLLDPKNGIGFYFERILSDDKLTRGGFSIYKRLKEHVKVYSIEMNHSFKCSDIEEYFDDDRYLYELRLNDTI